MTGKKYPSFFFLSNVTWKHESWDVCCHPRTLTQQIPKNGLPWCGNWSHPSHEEILWFSGSLTRVIFQLKKHPQLGWRYFCRIFWITVGPTKKPIVLRMMLFFEFMNFMKGALWSLRCVWIHNWYHGSGSAVIWDRGLEDGPEFFDDLPKKKNGDSPSQTRVW